MNCVRCKTVCPELEFTRNGKQMKTCNGCASKRKVHTSSMIDMDSIRKEHQEALRVQQMQMEMETMKLKHQLEIQQLKHEVELLKLKLQYSSSPSPLPSPPLLALPAPVIKLKRIEVRQLNDNEKRRSIHTVEQEQTEYKKLSNSMNTSSVEDLCNFIEKRTTSYRLETWKQHYFKWRVNYNLEKMGLSTCVLDDHNRLIMDPFRYITDDGELTEETITQNDFDKLVDKLKWTDIDDC